jgi:uncharacterized iron-regulated protein
VKSRFRLRRAALLAVSALALSGCLSSGDDDGGSDNGTTDVSSLLGDYATSAVLATYAHLAAQAQELNDAAASMQAASPFADTDVEAARSAWIAAREPWEQSESMLFGPVDTEGLDPALDTWPVDRTQLETAIAGGFDPDTADDNVRGFHTIEYILWDDNDSATGDLNGSNDDAADVAAYLNAQSDRLQYLVDITADLADNAAALESAWDPDGDDFAGEFESAGQGSQTYSSQSAAMQEIVNGMITIADEVANGKLYDPYSQEDIELVESQFSFNSLADFTDNILGVQNAYFGEFGAEEAVSGSLADLVASEDPDLDERLQASIQDSVDALAAIEPSFEQAVVDGDPNGTIAAAIEAINELREEMESELLPLVQGLDFTY